MTIKQIYKENCKLNSNIYRIKQLVNGVDSVIEYGTGKGIVTSAILDGLKKGAVCISYDMKPTDEAVKLRLQAKKESKKYYYRFGDSKEVIINKCDVLVIDSLHNANHLWAELYDAVGVVSKYIIILGTNKYGYEGEDEGHLGLRHCLDKFFSEYTGWEMLEDNTDDEYGMVVLKRI